MGSVVSNFDQIAVSEELKSPDQPRMVARRTSRITSTIRSGKSVGRHTHSAKKLVRVQVNVTGPARSLPKSLLLLVVCVDEIGSSSSIERLVVQHG